MEREASKSFITGERWEMRRSEQPYPDKFERLGEPCEKLYAVGEPGVLSMPSVAVVGSRRQTPYGAACARMVAAMAAEAGLAVVTGGARGCATAAIRETIGRSERAVIVPGSGCDRAYPPENAGLFQEAVDAGGVIAGECEWGEPPKPYRFARRNRLIAALADIVVAIEAGLPSGTFSLADQALILGKTVMAVPGPIFSATSRGANELVCQGAVPLVGESVLAREIERAIAADRGRDES